MCPPTVLITTPAAPSKLPSRIKFPERFSAKTNVTSVLTTNIAEPINELSLKITTSFFMSGSMLIVKFLLTIICFVNETVSVNKTTSSFALAELTAVSKLL